MHIQAEEYLSLRFTSVYKPLQPVFVKYGMKNNTKIDMDDGEIEFMFKNTEISERDVIINFLRTGLNIFHGFIIQKEYLKNNPDIAATTPIHEIQRFAERNEKEIKKDNTFIIKHIKAFHKKSSTVVTALKISKSQLNDYSQRLNNSDYVIGNHLYAEHIKTKKS